MERSKIPAKKNNGQRNNQKNAINRDKIIKKRIEILLSVGLIGVITGLIIGILIPIGGIKKSDYKKLAEDKKHIQYKLDSVNEELDLLKEQIEESKIFTSLDEDKKSQVINYINSLENEPTSSEIDVKTTDLYNKLYKNYAYSLGYLSIDDFNIVIDNFSYKYDILEEEDSKNIILKDEYEDDTVTLTFNKAKDVDNFILHSIRYNKKDKFIEVNNNDNNTTYIINNGNNSNVSNIKEQEKFIFTE